MNVFTTSHTKFPIPPTSLCLSSTTFPTICRTSYGIRSNLHASEDTSCHEDAPACHKPVCCPVGETQQLRLRKLSAGEAAKEHQSTRGGEFPRQKHVPEGKGENPRQRKGSGRSTQRNPTMAPRAAPQQKQHCTQTTREAKPATADSPPPRSSSFFCTKKPALGAATNSDAPRYSYAFPSPSSTSPKSFASWSSNPSM